MSVRRPALTALILLAMASTASAAPRLSATGLGRLRIGMPERDAIRLLHLRVPRSLGADSFDCRQDETPRYPGLFVMAEKGIVTRITIQAPSALVTDRGLGVGSTEDEIRHAYGPGLEIKTAAYQSEPAHDLIFWTAHKTRGVRYETNVAGAVEAIHVGGRSITYIEGCS